MLVYSVCYAGTTFPRALRYSSLPTFCNFDAFTTFQQVGEEPDAAHPSVATLVTPKEAHVPSPEDANAFWGTLETTARSVRYLHENES